MCWDHLKGSGEAALKLTFKRTTALGRGQRRIFRGWHVSSLPSSFHHIYYRLPGTRFVLLCRIFFTLWIDCPWPPSWRATSVMIRNHGLLRALQRNRMLGWSRFWYRGQGFWCRGEAVAPSLSLPPSSVNLCIIVAPNSFVDDFDLPSWTVFARQCRGDVISPWLYNAAVMLWCMCSCNVLHDFRFTIIHNIHTYIHTYYRYALYLINRERKKQLMIRKFGMKTPPQYRFRALGSQTEFFDFPNLLSSHQCAWNNDDNHKYMEMLRNFP